ncbi:cuticle protein 16.5-like [Microplitis mediator]|uniref:cuticle protein 16.5-like n=1 Tax=Microplitis mediator TaxID=375433 RepID=UPI002553005B|nr:cuticle protein 16.5-like [Microplitis mediator]
MFKLICIFALMAAASAGIAHPAPLIATAPAVHAPIVTARSSQVIARKYNTFAAAPLAYAAAPAIAAPAPIGYAASAAIAAPAPLGYAAPAAIAAPAPLAYTAPAHPLAYTAPAVVPHHAVAYSAPAYATAPLLFRK